MGEKIFQAIILLISLLLNFSLQNNSTISCSTITQKYFQTYVCLSESHIAKGSQAQAFLVKKDNQIFILKRIEITKENQVQLRNEQKFLPKVQGSPYVIQLHYNMQQDNQYFEILEFGAQKTLDVFLKVNSDMFKDSQFVLNLFEKIVKGVQHIHSKKVCHADLKLSNIVIDSKGDPKIIDFDLSVKLDRYESPRGTRNYSAPEILENWKLQQIIFDQFIDVYSLGVIFYQLVHKGRYPFLSKERNEQILPKRMNKFIINEKLPKKIKEIIRLCLKGDKRERGTINWLLEMIEEAKGEERQVVITRKEKVNEGVKTNKLKGKLLVKDGWNMKKNQFNFLIILLALFVIVPVLLYAIGNFVCKKNSIGLENLNKNNQGLFFKETQND